MSIMSRRWVYLKYGIWNRLMVARLKYQMHEYNPDNIERIKEFLNKFNTTSAATFVGMRQIKYSLGLEDAYNQTYDLLSNVYSSLIVPTFTYSVRNTGIYDVSQTQSELGAFSRQFTKHADFRSLAPIKSYAVKGPATEEFARLDFCDDYEAAGSFDFFDRANSVTINIGTDVLRPVRTHQLEYQLKVPYRHKIWRQFTIIDHQGVERCCLVADLALKGSPVKLNFAKWERDLLKNGLLRQLKINDLLIRVLPDQSYMDFFAEQTKKNPYYLVD